ncbi:MAG: hypothetical protein K6C40_11815 [Thermoguttaceae bacterium]|nr:hypothetical protein [Thermoguttaceae bacterium]
MKKFLTLLLSFTLCAALQAANVLEHENILIDEGIIQPAPAGKVIFDSASAENGGWDSAKINNYQNLLKIQPQADFEGEKCLVVYGADSDGCDTAWSASTVSIPIPAGKGRLFRLSFQFFSQVPFTGQEHAGETWQDLIYWFDSNGEQCGKTTLGFTPPCNHFSKVVVGGAIPENAASAVVQLGFDYPNVLRDQVVVVKDLQFALVDPEFPFKLGASFVPLLSQAGQVQCDADVPEGTALKFQVSQNDGQFVGPDGTEKSFFTEPPVLKDAASMVKIFIIPSADGKAAPKVRALTVAGKTFDAWKLRGDNFPPRVRIVSASPTTDAKTDLVLEITDSSPISKENFCVTVDGTDRTAEFEGDFPRLTLRAKEPWAEGLHRVNVAVRDVRGNRVEAKKVFFIGEAPKTPKVTLRDDGMTLIDGELFFPVGVYGVMRREFNDYNFDKAFAGLKEAGFNFAHSYSSPHEVEFLDAAQKYGFKLWTVAHHVDDEFINVLRHHPATLAWYLGDDTASNTTPSQLYDRDDAVKALDPTRITTQADPIHAAKEVSNYEDYVLGTDNFLPEIYPVRLEGEHSGDECVAQTIRDMKRCWSDIAQAHAGTKSVWPIIQYFQGWGWQRFPTWDELNAMSWASIIHGANGITWYTYGGTVEPEKKKFNYGVTTSPERWANISRLATRIRDLSPVLLERTGAQPAPAKILSGPEKDPLENDSISLLLKVHEGKSYLFTVNSSPEPVKASFTLPNASGAAEVLFEDRSVQVENGTLTDDFAGFAVHIYVF